MCQCVVVVVSHTHNKNTKNKKKSTIMMSRALIVLCFLATAVFSQKVDKCCENECSTAGTEKYYSIARVGDRQIIVEIVA